MASKKKIVVAKSRIPKAMLEGFHSRKGGAMQVATKPTRAKFKSRDRKEVRGGYYA